MPAQKYYPEDVYKAIVTYKMKHGGNSPSFRAIAAMCGIPSTSIVQVLIDKCKAAGWISFDNEGKRSLRVIGEVWSYTPPPAAPIVAAALRDIPRANDSKDRTEVRHDV